MSRPRAITAQPAGLDRFGAPLAVRAYTIDRNPEPFGPGCSRIFAENRSLRHPDGRYMFTPVVVVTDSIEPEPEDCHCGHDDCGAC